MAAGWCRWPKGGQVSRQLALAAEANELLGFHLRHFKQTDQHAEVVPACKYGQGGDGLR